MRGPEILILLFLLLIIAGAVGGIWFIVWIVKSASRPSTPASSRTYAPAPAATTVRPPGWYPVPDGSGRVAWWDGTKWDSTVAPPNTQ